MDTSGGTDMETATGRMDVERLQKERISGGCSDYYDKSGRASSL